MYLVGYYNGYIIFYINNISLFLKTILNRDGLPNIKSLSMFLEIAIKVIYYTMFNTIEG